MPQDFITKGVLDVTRETPSFPNVSVLDLSCGEGEILAELARDGCTVRGSRFISNDYIIKHDRLSSGVEVDNKVNLTAPLPYGDASFDIVILTEVVEHLDTFSSVIREVGRILKPGGTLILTTPNIHRIHSRWKFFLTGTHKLINRRVGWDLGPESLYAYHINPVDLPYLHTLLFHAKMRIESIRFTRIKYRHGAWFLLYPLFFLCHWLEFRQRSKDGMRQVGEADLRRIMLHPAICYSEQLFLVVRRELAPK